MVGQLGENVIPVMAIGCTFLFFVIWVLAATADSLYKTACNSRLKERLIERGCSALEIDRIIKAGSETAEPNEMSVPVPPVKAGKSYSVPG